MELHEQLEHIQSKEDLAKFIAGLRADLDTHAANWENPTLELFLEAMAAWLAAKDHLEKNRDCATEDLTWKVVAKMLYAAKVYE